VKRYQNFSLQTIESSFLFLKILEIRAHLNLAVLVRRSLRGRRQKEEKGGGRLEVYFFLIIRFIDTFIVYLPVFKTISTFEKEF